MILMIGEDEDGVVFYSLLFVSVFPPPSLHEIPLIYKHERPLLRTHERVLKPKAKRDTYLHFFFFVCE
jgi:hypothetical protein